MTNILGQSYWILLLPFLGFAVNALVLGNRFPRAAGILSTLLTGGAAVLTGVLVSGSFGANPGAAVLWEFPFLRFSETFIASMGMLFDPLSAMMLFVVTVISTLVHIYSLEYMKHDPSSGRFFAFLSLFTFAMLGLVVATNLFQMFFFWELVGISSYLLIGFWYQKPSAVSASKQAFILTRFADSFFLLGSFDFAVINSLSLADFSNSFIQLGIAEFSKAEGLAFGALFIFIGGWGKSALFPMHIWLPNAMEGPTPVSSIIHSATMVVAGVYLVARLFPFFMLHENILQLILILGIVTALFAAVIACTQTDIKRILAYSTLSQIGYMMFALGTLGYTASVFHVFTHAFFKCMLFLVAGAVIHQVHSNYLHSMGGLRKKMPWTYICALIACLSISGIPPFSGFFSKEEIFLSTLQNGHPVVFAFALLTSALTAFYMFRMFFLVFHGNARTPFEKPVKESLLMTFPIVVLAIFTVVSGFEKNIFAEYLVPLRATLPHASAGYPWVPFAATALSLAAIVLAGILYVSPRARIAKALDEDNRSRFYKIVAHKFYFDEIYYAIVRQFLLGGIAAFLKWFDNVIIGSLVKAVTVVFQKAGNAVRAADTGYLPFYLGTLIAGLLFWRFLGNLPL